MQRVRIVKSRSVEHPIRLSDGRGLGHFIFHDPNARPAHLPPIDFLFCNKLRLKWSDVSNAHQVNGLTGSV